MHRRHPPLVAWKQGSAAVPAEEDPEPEEARGELKGPSAPSQPPRRPREGLRPRSPNGRPNWPPSGRGGGGAERIRKAEANLRKAKAKVAEKEEAIEGFHRAVRRSERELAAVVARVKEEVVDEVVELDVEAKEVEEEILKEEEEAKVVVGTPAGGGG